MGWEASALAGGTQSGGKTRVRDPPWRRPLAEPTPRGASSPASLLRCLPVTPLCVLPRRDMTSRSIKGENGARQVLCAPPRSYPHGERRPPLVIPCRRPRGKTTYTVRGRGPSLAQSNPRATGILGTNQLADEGGLSGLPTRPPPWHPSRSSVVSPAAGGNLTAAGDGITRPRTAPTKPLCAEPTCKEQPFHVNREG